MPATDKQILTVSQLNATAQQLLEQLGTVWLEGEVSNHVHARSGHHYFSLKDDNAQVSAAFFRYAASKLTFPLRDGLQVLVRAKVSLYSPRGNYQIIVNHMEPAGEGRLLQQFEALKTKLQQEGLFADELKRPLPLYPQRIGIITSATGAALQDILSTLKKLSAHIPTELYPAVVQGKDAPASLQQALQQAIKDNRCDVLIIGRGGGSLEDLWGFNDETLARAVHQCPIPIISAVGHEIDFCLTDFVADWRAPTPTAAAEQLARASAQLPTLLEEYQRRFLRTITQQLQAKQQQLQSVQQRLRHPQQLLQLHQQRLDEMQWRLQKQQQNRQQQAQQQLAHLQHRLQMRSPIRQLQQQKEQLQRIPAQLARPLQQQIPQLQQRIALLQRRLPQLAEQQLQQLQKSFAQLSQRLDNNSPLATVARGYSLTYVNDEHVRSVAQVKPGDTLTARVSDGSITATVNDVQESKD